MPCTRGSCFLLPVPLPPPTLAETALSTESVPDASSFHGIRKARDSVERMSDCSSCQPDPRQNEAPHGPAGPADLLPWHLHMVQQESSCSWPGAHRGRARRASQSYICHLAAGQELRVKPPFTRGSDATHSPGFGMLGKPDTSPRQDAGHRGLPAPSLPRACVAPNGRGVKVKNVRTEAAGKGVVQVSQLSLQFLIPVIFKSTGKLTQ